jgi:glucokinase
MIIKENGLICSCSQRGHLEAYASGTAMVKIYQKITGQKHDALFIEQKFHQKDKNAVKVFKIMTEALACGLTNIINIFNPEIIILGGGLSKIKPLIEPAIALAKEQTLYPKSNKTRIAISTLKDNAAILGSTLLFK